MPEPSTKSVDIAKAVDESETSTRKIFLPQGGPGRRSHGVRTFVAAITFLVVAAFSLSQISVYNLSSIVAVYD